MKNFLTRYFSSESLPSLVYLSLLFAFTITASTRWMPNVVVHGLFYLVGFAFLGLIGVAVWHLLRKRWKLGLNNLVRVLGCGVITFFAFVYLTVAAMMGPSEDGFADNLTIPDDIEIAEPEPGTTDRWDANRWSSGSDSFQDSVRTALTKPGNDETEVVPSMPSLRKASTDHFDLFLGYIVASPDWHVFIERGNCFAARRWSYEGEPQHELHGYISEWSADFRFQTRCLLCLDRKGWGRYSVQNIQEGNAPVTLRMTEESAFLPKDRIMSYESRSMIECGGVWVEIFEESDKLERRVTKATVSSLEEELSEFLKSPKDAIAEAQARSRELANQHSGKDGQPFRLLTDGGQGGNYCVVYSLNPGEPGVLYLKAFEVTKGTPLSVYRLEEKSKTRMAWSTETTDQFWAKTGFTIYEGDWGKPYAARFEVWLKPDSSRTERKLAERIYKIEGWQR